MRRFLTISAIGALTWLTVSVAGLAYGVPILAAHLFALVPTGIICLLLTIATTKDGDKTMDVGYSAFIFMLFAMGTVGAYLAYTNVNLVVAGFAIMFYLGALAMMIAWYLDIRNKSKTILRPPR